MKSYATLIKKLKQEIDNKQKELERARGEKANIEQQIELLLETIEKEKFFVRSQKISFSTGYFESASKKISSYTQMVVRKVREIDGLSDELLELFRERKKYELLRDSAMHRRAEDLRKKADFEMQDIFQSARSSFE